MDSYRLEITIFKFQKRTTRGNLSLKGAMKLIVTGMKFGADILSMRIDGFILLILGLADIISIPISFTKILFQNVSPIFPEEFE